MLKPPIKIYKKALKSEKARIKISEERICFPSKLDVMKTGLEVIKLFHDQRS